MKRFQRTTALSRLAVAGLGLACLVSLVAWLTSYRWFLAGGFVIEHYAKSSWIERAVSLESDGGGVGLKFRWHAADGSEVEWSPFPAAHWEFHPFGACEQDGDYLTLSDEAEPGTEWFGFRYGDGGLIHGAWGRGYDHEWIVPWPVIVLLTALLPARRARRAWITRRRIKAGHCLRCGYDLRSSPDRCPECGTVAVTAGKADPVV